MHEKTTVSDNKKTNTNSAQGFTIYKNSTITTEAHQLYVGSKHNDDSQIVVRKTFETHKPTNKKDAFSRNNDIAKANYSFYTQTQHLTVAHYSRLQHLIDSCRTIKDEQSTKDML